MNDMDMETPFFIHEDAHHRDRNDEIASSDIPLLSIEDEPEHFLDEDEDGVSRYTGRRASLLTSTSFVSSLPSELPSELPQEKVTFTPMKNRPTFRNVSSVKAMHLDSEPPSRGSSPLSEKPRRRTRPRRDESLLSERSERSHMSDRRRERSKHGDTPQAPVQPPAPSGPLVLLHVSLLPYSASYPAHLLESTLPDWLLDNFRVLEAKLADPVLANRGVLIPHPQSDFELLEERILETLDLITPRISACGHFRMHDTVDEDNNSEDEVLRVKGAVRNPSSTTNDSGSTETNCYECSHPISLPSHGVGSGKNRWDVKVFAANGLMRVGAWSVAWGEIERVDAEISPWIPPQLRRELGRKMDAEMREAQANRTASQLLLAGSTGLPSPPRSMASPEPLGGMLEPPSMGKKREWQPHLNVLETTSERSPSGLAIFPSQRTPEKTPERSSSVARLAAFVEAQMKDQSEGQVSLTTLLKNCFMLIMRDRRNVAIGILSALVVLISFNGFRIGTHEPQGPAIAQRTEMSNVSEMVAPNQGGVPRVETQILTETVFNTQAFPQSTTVPGAQSDIELKVAEAPVSPSIQYSLTQAEMSLQHAQTTDTTELFPAASTEANIGSEYKSQSESSSATQSDIPNASTSSTATAMEAAMRKSSINTPVLDSSLVEQLSSPRISSEATSAEATSEPSSSPMTVHSAFDAVGMACPNLQGTEPFLTKQQCPVMDLVVS